MKTDKMRIHFKNIREDFDVEVPEVGHQQRFLDKLNAPPLQTDPRQLKSPYLKTWLAIAATVLISLGLFVFMQAKPPIEDLASVSPKLSQTQDFFTTAIASQLNKVKAQRNPENDILVEDALNQLLLLEKNYEKLKADLKQSGNDQRVIYAMISNFQSRIVILENVLETINDLKQVENSAHSQKIL